MINYNSLFCFQFSKQQLSKFRVNNDLKNIDIDTWNSFIISEFETLHKLKIITFVHTNNIIKFIEDIFYFYKSTVSFHNHLHVLDVFQLGCCLIQRNINKLYTLNEKDIFTYIISLILHDIGHIGITNEDHTYKDIFLYDSDSSEDDSTSTMYSYSHEDSINELGHITLGFYLLQKHKIIINKKLYGRLIAYTDLAIHKVFLKTDLIYNPFYGNQIINEIVQENILILFMKLSDIGHIIRPWNVHFKFVVNLNKERKDPFSLNLLVDDTIKFNTTFVLPLIEKIRDLNIGLYTKILKYYTQNMNKWIFLKDSFHLYKNI
tara:strand:+ start:517 stop:1473 length:957 start_codon:yes stop_codon:yes gene_type:complete